MTRPPRSGPHGDDRPVSEAELAEIARQLREIMPGAAGPAPPASVTSPIRRPSGDRLAVARFLAGFLIPGLLIVAIALIGHAIG